MLNLGLIGTNLQHSKSPKIHYYIYSMLNIEAKYNLYEIQNLKYFFNTGCENLDGFNITFPFKEDILQYCDYVEPRALEIGAVNTVIKKNDKYYGYNTDIDGFAYYFDNVIYDYKKENILLIGYGGAGKTVSYYLKSENYNFTVTNRDFVKVKEEKVIKIENIQKKINSFDVIINATSTGYDSNPILQTKLKKNQILIDLNYNNYFTPLIEVSKQQEFKYKNGLDMLIVQAIKAASLFLNIRINDIEKLLFKIKLKIIDRKILIDGFMGSGKTSIFKSYEEKLDLDVLIVNKEGMSISNIFKKYGEKYFRKRELEIFNNINQNNVIISLGGGFSFWNKTYINENKEKFIIIFLDRELREIKKNISNSKSRPLMKNIDNLYKERINNYNDIYDIKISNNKTLKELEYEIIRWL